MTPAEKLDLIVGALRADPALLEPYPLNDAGDLQPPLPFEEVA